MYSYLNCEGLNVAVLLEIRLLLSALYGFTCRAFKWAKGVF